MAPIHLIVLNLVYDLSCIALPFDNVDEDFETSSHSGKLSLSLALWFGWVPFLLPLTFWPLSCFILSLSQWRQVNPMFTEQSLQRALSSCSRQVGSLNPCGPQTMVIHMFRSAKLPFLQSRPSWFVLGTTLLAASFVTFLPYSSIASLLHLTPLEPIYFLFLLWLLFSIW